MLNKDIHRQKMYDILQDIFTSEVWKYLAFKWGTACYFFHTLDRFSTDLDFDLIKDYENLDSDILNILKKYWDVKNWKYNIKLSYWEWDVNIKIDINRTVWDNNSYELLNFYGTDILTQDKPTIFANKLVALTERNTTRDIYDVYFFFKNSFEINDKLIIERTKKTRKELFTQIISKLKNLWETYKILNWLWEVLRDEKHKAFVKNKLVKELIWVLQFKVDFE